MLERFERAVAREAHNLARWPELTWQQLHNRLQWEDEPVRSRLGVQRRGGRDTVRLWDAESKLPLHVIHTAGPLDACACSPDGLRIVSGGWKGALQVWSARGGTALGDLAGHATGRLSGAVGACAFSPDGRFVASAGDDGTFRLWDVEGGAVLAVLPLNGRGASVAMHPYLPRAACGDESGALHLVDLVGVEYGPIVVTGVEADGNRTLRCPRCWVDCPECGLRLRVNPLVARPLRDSPVDSGGVRANAGGTSPSSVAAPPAARVAAVNLGSTRRRG